MPKRLAYDRGLFFTTVALVTFGLLMVFSASAITAEQKYHSPYTFVLKQALFVVIGSIAMLLVMRLDYRRLKHPAVIYIGLCLTVSMLTLVLLLDRTQNTHRWLRLGPISIQPSELAKPALILFLAFFLETRLRQINEKTTWLPIVFCLGIISLLVLAGRDLGTTIALAAIAATMCFSAGMRLRHFAVATLCCSPILYWMVFHTPYRRARILAFLHPWQQAQAAGYQITQSLIAVGTGGLTGVGLMNSKQKLFFLPAAHTDFIFAVASEEFGLLGSAAVVAAFTFFLWRGLRIARGAPDNFGRLLAIGVTAMIVIQALINLSVVVSLLPNKGIPLPFMSYGGSSIVFALLAVGMLLNVSQHTN